MGAESLFDLYRDCHVLLEQSLNRKLVADKMMLIIRNIDRKNSIERLPQKFLLRNI
jgi:hypothetical protein